MRAQNSSETSIVDGFALAAAAVYNPSLKHLDKKLSRYLDGNPVRVDGKPRASGIMDTVSWNDSMQLDLSHLDFCRFEQQLLME